MKPAGREEGQTKNYPGLAEPGRIHSAATRLTCFQQRYPVNGIPGFRNRIILTAVAAGKWFFR